MPPQEDAEEESFFEKIEFAFIFTLSVVVLFLAILFSNNVTSAKVCGDGSLYGSCSTTKPYYCESGFLEEKASICSCSGLSGVSGDLCISEYKTAPKEIMLSYNLDGEKKSFSFTVYGGLMTYFGNQSRAISYLDGEEPQRVDFELKVLDDAQQKELLAPLIIAIQNQTKDKTDQARIAISLVQNIPYGFSNKTFVFLGKKINYSRYPYEVLYDSEGICGEKSELLVFLLRELGYETVLFYNQEENHEAVGIKCPMEESYKGTGYCFIETTAPAIISDDEITYVGGVTLKTDPEVILISNGTSLPYGLPEYGDAEAMENIRNGKVLILKNFELKRLQNKYGLVEEYNIR